MFEAQHNLSFPTIISMERTRSFHLSENMLGVLSRAYGTELLNG